jgi:hypothetical protein
MMKRDPLAQSEWNLIIHNYFRPSTLYFSLARKMDDYEKIMNEWNRDHGRLMWERAVMRS